MINEIIDWFANSGNASFVTFLVSIISIIIAIIALTTSIRTQKRQLAIEEKREQDRLSEMNKADLTAQLVSKSSRPHDYLLRIENKGLSEARDLKILLDDLPILKHPAIPQGLEEIRQIGPQSPVQYLMDISQDNHPPFDILITWSDDSGEPGTYKTTLTF